MLHSHKKDGTVLLPEMQLADALKEQGNPEALSLFYSFEVEDSAEQFAALSVLADGSSSAQASAAGTSAMPITALPSDVLSLVLAQLHLVRNIKGVKRTGGRSARLRGRHASSARRSLLHRGVL